nr:hypothetical protein [uncultured archaeon]
MIISFDISTTCTGYSIFSEDYKLQEISYIKFGKKLTLFEKLDEFIKHFEKYSELKVTAMVVEEPLKKFAGKFSNADTIQRLTQMNAMISGYLYKKFNVEPIYYNVLSARKTALPNLIIPQKFPNKKYLVWEAVMKLEPTLNWIYNKNGKLADENFDMTDSYVVGMAHIVSIIRHKTSQKVKEQV